MKTVTSAASVPQLPSVETSIAVEVNVGPEMEKAIKIAQIQTGVESSGADDTVSKALFAHSFPRSVPKN